MWYSRRWAALAAVSAACGAARCGANDDFYVFMNEYGADNLDNNECNMEARWEHVTISRLRTGCHRLAPNPFKPTEAQYTDFVVGGNNRSDPRPMEYLGLICDPGGDGSSCRSCAASHERQQYGTCIDSEYAGGSLVLYPKEYYCEGAPQLRLQENSFSIFYYEKKQCSMTLDDDVDNVLHIRNYGAFSGTCEPDGTKQDRRYHMLSMADGKDGKVFTGKLRCTDSNCTQGCTEISDVVEGECHVPSSGELAGNGMKIWRSKEVLSNCKDPNGIPQPPGPPGPPPPPRPSPNTAASTDDPELVAALVGGGAALAFIVFGVAFIYRRNSAAHARQDAAYSARYHQARNYGTLDDEEEGMTTDI